MTIAETTFVLTDTETTRKEAADHEQEVVEVCTVLARDTGHGLPAFVDQFTALVFAQHSIPPASSGVHHLTDADLIGQPTREQVDERLAAFVPAEAVPVAWNAPFDAVVLGNERNGLGPPREWLCALRLAKHLQPQAPDFKLGTMFYYNGGERRHLPPDVAAHRAPFDVAMLAHVFFQLLDWYRVYARNVCGEDEARYAKSQELASLLAFTRRPYTMTHWPAFGKHARTPFAEVPRDYLEWCLSPKGLTDMDADLRWNIMRALQA